MADEVLAMQNVGFAYTPSHKVISSFDLTAWQGDFIALLGPSGSGKSTVLRLMAGLLQPQTGDVRRKGVPVLHLPPGKRQIGIVFQGLSLFPNLDVESNVAFGLRQTNRASREIQSRVDELLDLLQISSIRKQRPRTLSGGQAQRVAIARALALETEVLLLDEPFSSLDRTVADISCDLIQRIHRERRLTSVLVTHDRHYALSLATRVVVLSAGGQILEDGSPQSVYQSPETLEGARLTGRLLELPSTIAAVHANEIDVMAIGGTLRASKPAACEFHPHQVVTLAARPEHVRVVVGLANPALACKFVRPSVVDRPDEIIVRTRDGSELIATCSAGDRANLNGQPLQLLIDPKHLYCFPTGGN